MTFIDDSTRKVWVYFMKNKSDVFMTFKKWKSQVELESSCKVKCLRSDNGDEYVSHEFKNLYLEQGIRMEKTVPKTPQQNTVAERMNRTLNKRARSMRLHTGLQESFWADAINTAAHLINKGPLVPLEYQLPEECWTRRKVDLSYLRIFGCLCYVLVDSDSRDKLDAKSKKCYFIGYGGEEFGYRLWDDVDQKILWSQNVVFNETIVYKDKDAASLVQEASMKPIEMEDIHDEAHMPRVRPLGRCYSTHQAGRFVRMLALVPVCHCAPRGACLAGAIVPAKLRTAGVLWHMVGTTSAGATVPTDCAPRVRAWCSPLRSTAVPRAPAMHGDGKSPPTPPSSFSVPLPTLPLSPHSPLSPSPTYLTPYLYLSLPYSASIPPLPPPPASLSHPLIEITWEHIRSHTHIQHKNVRINISRAAQTHIIQTKNIDTSA